jgi:DNA helicase-2/ATP-dependent DNA helicase PcrA
VISTELLADLTEAQRTAVCHVDGPLLVLAGPGSGKTRVITRRVAHLIALGIPAWQILAVTFTNKAAGEMRERIDHLLPANIPGRRGLVVSTFHALCARLLRRYALQAGLDPAFVIYDSADQKELVKQAIHELELNDSQYAPGAILGAISRAKNDLLDVEAFALQARDFRDRQIARIYAAYQRALTASKAVDFDDLLLKTAQLLARDDGVRAELSERFRYLLVDEYQDTNQAQFEIARSIASGHRNICVVGDPDQSIYGWRGADIRNILEFEERFENAVIVPLGENFRSTGHIVAASAALIAGNRRRRHKELFTGLEPGHRVRVRCCADEQSEAAAVVESLLELSHQGVPWREMAVLYRMNALSRVLEDALRRRGIPYQIARGTAFFDRKEVRDALAYLRLLANPSDSVSLGRIVNFPARGLGDTSLGRVEAAGRRWGVSTLEALRRADEVSDLPPRARAAAMGFGSMLERWRADAVVAGAPTPAALSHLVLRVLDESGLREHYAGEDTRRGTEDGEDRRANLDELVSAAAQWMPPPSEVEETALRPLSSLLDRLSLWLESVALVSDADAMDSERGAVTLMTLHAAKGLEFDAVHMVGLEEGLLPHARFDSSDRDLEEERRLCYVGMTRARRRLTLSWTKVRTMRGFTERRMASSFLEELPAQDIERLGEGRRSTPMRGAATRPRRGSGDEIDEAPDYEAGDEAPRRGVAGSLDGAFTVGDLVRHPQFGLGRVEAMMPRGASSTVRVRFESVGAKNLVLAYARLELVT